MVELKSLEREFFESVQTITPKVDNKLVVSTLLAEIANELRVLNKILAEKGVRVQR
jgi:hypothetical protein